MVQAPRCCQWKQRRVVVQRLWTEVPLADRPAQPPEGLQSEGECDRDTPLTSHEDEGHNAISTHHICIYLHTIFIDIY